MRGGRLGLMVAVALCVFAVRATAAERVELVVDMAGIRTAAPYPVRSGVPLARGKVPSADNVRVLMAGREIDAQARALAVWPDRSVKWVLLDFLARDGDKVTVEYGADVRRKRIARGIEVKKTADAISLDTGEIWLTVKRRGTAFIRRAVTPSVPCRSPAEAGTSGIRILRRFASPQA